MKIGITLSLLEEYESLWVNGIKLNALNLVKTLQQIEGYEVFILDTGDKVEDLTKVSWDYNKYPIKKFKDAVYELNLLIMLGTALPKNTINVIKQNNPKIKIVKYQCGNNYVIDMERVLFDKDASGLPSWDSGHDETWMIPQQEFHNREYYEMVYNQEPESVKVVPFVWDPEHMVRSTVALHKAGKKIPGYKPSSRSEKRISIMEPNMNVVKYSLIPIMISEKVFRDFGEGAFKQVYVGSGNHMLKNAYYKGMINTFNLVKNNPPLIKYVPRYPVTVFLASETDIVVSHQWGNPLNYAYLDALFFNYPLVHNAEMIKDAGYYYPNFEINKGAKQLEKVLSKHDEPNNLEKYKENNQEVLHRYTSTNPEIVDTYRKLIENLFEPNKHKLSYKYNPKTNLYK
jgi:hypothetical protein